MSIESYKDFKPEMNQKDWDSEIDNLCKEVTGISASRYSEALLWDYWVSGYSPQDALEELVNSEE